MDEIDSEIDREIALPVRSAPSVARARGATPLSRTRFGNPWTDVSCERGGPDGANREQISDMRCESGNVQWRIITIADITAIPAVISGLLFVPPTT